MPADLLQRIADGRVDGLNPTGYHLDASERQWLKDEVRRLAEAFPGKWDDDVTGWTGGFDVVLGNPPWKRIKLQEKEFFASRDPAIAAARNVAARRKLILIPVVLTDWLSIIPALGVSSRPSAWRACSRNAVSNFSHVPFLRHLRKW